MRLAPHAGYFSMTLRSHIVPISRLASWTLEDECGGTTPVIDVLVFFFLDVC